MMRPESAQVRVVNPFDVGCAALLSDRSVNFSSHIESIFTDTARVVQINLPLVHPSRLNYFFVLPSHGILAAGTSIPVVPHTQRSSTLPATDALRPLNRYPTYVADFHPPRRQALGLVHTSSSTYSIDAVSHPALHAPLAYVTSHPRCSLTNQTTLPTFCNHDADP